MTIRFRDLALIGVFGFGPVVTGAQQSNLPPSAVDQTLLPGDVIRVAIWREPDLSGDFLVDERGVVTLPLLGKWNVLDAPIASLRDSLIAAYAVQLRNPSVTITPLRRISVLGEVTKPGLYIVDPTITLAGAVALAGGPTPIGDMNRLRVVRKDKVVLRAGDGASLRTIEIRSDDQIFVDRRGWLDRNGTLVASALISVATIVVTVLLR